MIKNSNAIELSQNLKLNYKYSQFLVIYRGTLEKELATHSSILPWRLPGRRSLVGYRLWGRTESDTTEGT